MSRVVADRRLQRRQHWHSLIFTLAGAIGVVLAITLALDHGLSLMAIGLFAAMFFPVAFGVTVGFHRHFTHRSFRASSFVRSSLAALGCMAAQGPVTFWVALHRHHHALSDRAGDPHSPNLHGAGFAGRLKGIYHAYIGWTLTHEVPSVNYYARDILADKKIMAINRAYYVWILLGLAAPAIAGGVLARSLLGCLEGFVWGGLVRMFAVHNMIWWITSFAHVFGSRDLKSDDQSRNNAWMALPTLGEAWHNNHHAFPSAAILRFRWWQIDPSGFVIRALESVGLAWDVQAPTHSQIVAKRVAG